MSLLMFLDNINVLCFIEVIFPCRCFFICVLMLFIGYKTMEYHSVYLLDVHNGQDTTAVGTNRDRWLHHKTPLTYTTTSIKPILYEQEVYDIVALVLDTKKWFSFGPHHRRIWPPRYFSATFFNASLTSSWDC